MPSPARKRWIKLCAEAAAKASEGVKLPQFVETCERAPPKSMGDEAWASSHYEWLLQAIESLIELCSDALELYVPLPGEAERFHASRTGIRLLTGSNQAGKSLTAAAEFARVARGRDPYKKRADSNLRMQVVAYDERSFADILWQKLGWVGAFWIVPDENTGLWRAVRPNPEDPTDLDPIDTSRRHLWKPAPPLIPSSDIEDIAWRVAKRGVPDRIFFKNGTIATCHTSRGNPQQGVELDYAWYDEEIDRKAWLGETMARLVKRDGIFVWSATPQHATEQLLELHRRRLNGDPDVDEFLLLTANNPYLSKDGRRKMFERLKALGEEELRVRWYGEYAAESRKIYPQFNPAIGANLVTPFRIPKDWMRFLVVDPGTSFSGALFLAVPPDGSEVHAYDEVFLKNTPARGLANAVRSKVVDGVMFEAFLIDYRAGRETPMGYETRVVDQYSEAFKEHGLKSSRTDSGFIFACDDVALRTEVLRCLFAEDESGLRRIKVHSDSCSVLIQQILNRRVSRTSVSKRELSDRATKASIRSELLDCLEYGVVWLVQESGGVGERFYWRRPRVDEVVSEPQSAVYRDYQNTLSSIIRKKPGFVSLS